VCGPTCNTRTAGSRLPVALSNVPRTNTRSSNVATSTRRHFSKRLRVFHNVVPWNKNEIDNIIPYLIKACYLFSEPSKIYHYSLPHYSNFNIMFIFFPPCFTCDLIRKGSINILYVIIVSASVLRKHSVNTQVRTYLEIPHYIFFLSLSCSSFRSHFLMHLYQ
jgi:hypothetical protein